MSKKNRSRAYVHDRLYALADKLLKRHNPCHNCIVHNCFKDEHVERCCVGCPHFNNGCTVKALYCKLWLCEDVFNGYLPLFRRLHSLRRIAQKYNLLVARASRKETLEFGEQLEDHHWWLYRRDYYNDRALSHKLLREGV